MQIEQIFVCPEFYIFKNLADRDGFKDVASHLALSKERASNFYLKCLFSTYSECSSKPVGLQNMVGVGIEPTTFRILFQPNVLELKGRFQSQIHMFMWTTFQQ